MLEPISITIPTLTGCWAVLLHRDVERSSAKGLGYRQLQGNWVFVALKLPIPQAIRTTDQIHGAVRLARS